MIAPEIGQFALALAFMLALVQGTLPLVGAHRGNRAWMNIARPSAQALFVLIAFAFGCLTYAFVTNDFSVLYVAQHSNSALPLEYRVAGVWGGHEGSLLLWVLMLSVWMLAVTLFSRHLPDEMIARVLGIMGLVAVGFLAFMLFTSNPFDRLIPAAADGRDLNPLLQDPGMVFHPPMLYMGYVGFSVAYAFAVAALLSGRLDAAWARWSRPWTTAAWIFLTLGIALGSGWAYYELGWGGWWFWDPVENASFMPWLVGTALIHSLAVTEKRGAFRSWTVLLAIMAFALSLLGRFSCARVCSPPCTPSRPIPSAEFSYSHFWRSSSAARWCFTHGARRVSGSVERSTWSRVSRCCSRTTCSSSRRWARCCWEHSIPSCSTRSGSASSRWARRTSKACSCRSWRPRCS
jgi:cytochrome c-type biogenesis protein CcmF